MMRKQTPALHRFDHTFWAHRFHDALLGSINTHGYFAEGAEWAVRELRYARLLQTDRRNGYVAAMADLRTLVNDLATLDDPQSGALYDLLYGVYLKLAKVSE